MQSQAAPVEQKTTRRRKVQAVLAGGTVLGIGALVTLAAWNDSEFAEGLFGAGAFNLEGAVVAEPDDDDFDDHDSIDGAAQLTFAADEMIPGETVYAPFHVRLDEATTVGGTLDSISVTNPNEEDGNLEYLAYSIYANPASCDDQGVTDGTPIGGGNTLSDFEGNVDISLDPGDDAAGAPELLCFVVTADEDELVQGETATAIWEVAATSDEG